MKTIKATLYKTDGSKEPLLLTSKTRLKTLQRLVGGYIEVIYIVSFLDQLRGKFDGGKDLVINDEGLLLDLPVNPWSQLVALNSIYEDHDFRGDIILIDGKLP